MWGEIDPPVPALREQPSSPFSSLTSLTSFEHQENSISPEVLLQRYRPIDTLQPSADSQIVSHAETVSVDEMLKAIANSAGPVKSQQRGDAELSLQERRDELLQQYKSRPLVFLERYHAYLKPQDLCAFAHVCSDARVQHYSKVIQRRAAACTNRTRVRNKRYAALRALQREGQYFSEEQMRMREPLLYEQYIGQYLTDEEVLERSQEAMQGNAPGAPAGGAGGLAHLLLDSYQERLIQNRLQEEQDREDGAQEEEEDDDEGEECRPQQEGREPSPEEKALLREEFISQMHQHFLDGKDKDFNYSEVDENPDYDNLDIVSRDAEEKYFDEDDESEEDEVENDAEEEDMAE